ncbi:uncharacterized protein N7503_004985 [Penicillium pulvis]|uniref:uncharacterized protein n=1 Tax=Penicillium pulvis TaxID=1562058 RepID=UPI0025471711|nr:uncharacterized protein N7503_004985 [Penicillium pulvis]KAJ5802535.1 hypothetical protein N7503_004985 [Penicillium pulvis]
MGRGRVGPISCPDTKTAGDPPAFAPAACLVSAKFHARNGLGMGPERLPLYYSQHLIMMEWKY